MDIYQLYGYTVDGVGNKVGTLLFENQRNEELTIDIRYADVTVEALHSWRYGELVQNAMPGLTVDDRELLISGLLPTDFDAIFE